MTGVAFVDTETTGLDPDRHEIWEVGLIMPDGTEHEWQLPVDLSRADPIALNIGRFHDRRAAGWRTWQVDEDDRTKICDPEHFSHGFARLTRGVHLCGAVVSFDAERLWRLLRANGECPMWHYHLIDVENLAVGWLRGRSFGVGTSPPADAMSRAVLSLPWKSEELSRAVGVDPEQFDRHSALGDARWAKAIYEAVMA